MPSRAAVLLTPLESSHLKSLPFDKHIAPISPLFATHSGCPQITENKPALSPLLATHTDFAPVSPVFATHTKTTGVYINNSYSGTLHGYAHQKRHNDPKGFPFHGTMEGMAVRLIALDIDGTLLDSRWQLPEANRVAIAEAARRGIEVALVTGRRYDFAMPVARQIDSPLTMIVNNGALIRSKEGQTHLRHLLPRDISERVLQLTKPWRVGAAVVFDRPRENQVMLETLDPDDSLRYAYYSRNIEFIGLANPLETCLTEDPIQVMFSGNVAAMREAEVALREAAFAGEYGLAVTSYVSRDFAMIDVIHPECSKGSSLAEWAALRGVAREEVLAIGDNHNDLEMLEFAGIPVVMGNGVPELKTFGWHETATNDESGVAAAIEHFAFREAASCA